MNRTRSRILISLLVAAFIFLAWGFVATLSGNGFFAALHRKGAGKSMVRLDAQAAYDRFQPVLDEVSKGFGIQGPYGFPPHSYPCYDPGDPDAQEELPRSNINNGDFVTFSPYKITVTQDFKGTNGVPDDQIDSIMKRIHDYLQRNGWRIVKYAPLPPSPPNAEVEVNATSATGYRVSILGLRGKNNISFDLSSPCYVHPAAK